MEKETEIDERYFRSFSSIYTFHPACWRQVVSMRVNTIWRGEENHRKKKQFCNFPLLKGAFQLVGRLLFSVHDLEMITLTSFFSGHHYHYHYYHLLTTIMFKIPETACFQQAGWNGHGKLAVFFSPSQ